MTGQATRKLTVTKQMLHTICNALNAEAAVLEDQAKYEKFPEDSRAVLMASAEENRFLTRVLLKQWEKNDR